MPECTADATWNGTVMDGDGYVSLGSEVWHGPYGTPEAADATDPEELLASAHASCFAMTTAFLLNEFGYHPECVDATAQVTLCQTDSGFDIPRIDLTVDGNVPDATAEEFDDVLAQAEDACPLSKALAGTEIEVTGSLESSDGERPPRRTG